MVLKIYAKIDNIPVTTFNLENNDCLSSNVSINNIPSTFVSLDDENCSIKTSNIEVCKKDYNDELTASIIKSVDRYFSSK